MSALEPATAPAWDAGYVRQLCHDARRAGADVDQALAFSGLDLTCDDLQRISEPLPLQRLRWLVPALQRELGPVGLAFESGAALTLQSQGVPGQVMRTAPSLRAALGLLLPLLQLRSTALQVRQQACHSGALFTLHADRAPSDLRRFVLDHVLGQLGQVVHARLGRVPSEARLQMPWPAPPWAQVYRRLAGQVSFDAPSLAWWLPDGLLDHACADACELGFRSARCASEAERQALLFQQRLSVRILQGLQGQDAPCLDAHAVASRLGLSYRTLARRLACEGTSFQDLVDEWRKASALALLRDSHRSVAEVAIRLGFRSSSNFSRSVRRWFGSTPGVLRRTP